MKKIIILFLLVIVVGCSDVHSPGTSPQNNGLSSQWAGTYEGVGFLTYEAVYIFEEQRNVTLRITDMLDDWIKVQVYVRPATPLTPVFNMEYKVLNSSNLFHGTLEGSFYYDIAIRKSGSRVWGGLQITDQNGVEQWELNFFNVTK